MRRELEHDVRQPRPPARRGLRFQAEDAAEAMTRGSHARRAVVWVLARDAVSTKRAPRGAKERADLATTLRSALARKGRCQKDQRPLVVGAHLRFATSPRSFAKEAHPQLARAVRTEVNGTKTTRIVPMPTTGISSDRKAFGGESGPWPLMN